MVTFKNKSKNTGGFGLDEKGYPLPTKNPKSPYPVCPSGLKIDNDFDITDPLNPPFRCIPDISVTNNQNQRNQPNKIMNNPKNPSNNITRLAKPAKPAIKSLPPSSGGGGATRTRRRPHIKRRRHRRTSSRHNRHR